MRTHLEARYNLATSRKRDDLTVFSPLNNEINKLRYRLEKLTTMNTEATPSTITSPFSAQIQQVPLLTGFKMPTMETYEG